MLEKDPYKYFRVEAAELAERLGQGALAIDKGGALAGGVAAMLRHAHTLKGAARVVKQIEIAEHAHAIEDVLAPHRARTDTVPRECAVPLFASIDAITGLLAKLGAAPDTRAQAPSPAPAPPPALASAIGAAPATPTGPESALSAASPASSPASPPAPSPAPRAPSAESSPKARAAEEPSVTLRAEVAEVEAVVDGLGEALVEIEALKNPLAAVEQVRQLAELLAKQLAAPRRADSERLITLLERSQRVAEDLRQGLGRFDRGLLHGVGRLRRQLEQTHSAAERLRLVPAGSIFTALERAAYDAARELGRHVHFITRGGEVKLDSHLLVVAQGALLHVVRNSVVHGLEPEAVRVRAGKPALGSIWLSIERRGRHVLFTGRDDGAGVDIEKVRTTLSKHGENAAGLSDDQLLERLLRGGVSTTSDVTRLSGRGVGLDVVREAGEVLGGSAKLKSSRGQGFSVELRVPLSVAAVSVVAVESAGKTLSVPLDRVVESVRFSRAEITRSGVHESVCHQGKVLPFAPLARVVGGDGTAAAAARAWTSLIVAGVGGRAAVGVDRLLGARTVVIRPLPDVAGTAAVVAGATLDALGNPELVLDGDALVAAVQRTQGVAAAPSVASRPILVIDDSLTTRMLEQSILESAGYEVALATSGEEGLEKARQSPYALFLVDVEMPGIDGFTFVDRARHDPALAHVPSVLVSSRNAPEDFARGKEVGAHGYIVKGRFDQRELLGLIERLVNA
jgi:two-component system chemotaxis sensor kinase CheA